MTTMSFIKKIKRNGNTYAIEVDGYRDKDGKVKHRYKRYLGRIDENGKIVPTHGDVSVDRVFKFGFPHIVKSSIEEVGLKGALREYKDEIAFLVMSQLCSPASISKTLRRAGSFDPSALGGLELPVNRKRIEAALDFLDENKELIEQKLYDHMKGRYNKQTLFYDITSIALSGHRSALAKIGYPEFEPQINIGLCIEGKRGFPIFHDVFAGNISHKKTLRQVTERLEAFGRAGAVMIFDAGVAGSEKHVDEIAGSGFDVITRIPMHENIKKLALANISSSFADMVQLSGTKVYAKELAKEKGKLLVCFNEKMKVAIKEKRYDEVLSAIERKKKKLAIKEGLKQYIEKKNGAWVIKYSEVEEAERYDGIYVLYCSIKDMPKDAAVNAYFERDRIEKCFSLMKSEIEIDPLRFQMDKRIRARVTLCFLAYLVATNIEVKLKENGIPYSFDRAKEALENVYKVRIHRGEKVLERISSMNDEQKKITGLFGPLS